MTIINLIAFFKKNLECGGKEGCGAWIMSYYFSCYSTFHPILNSIEVNYYLLEAYHVSGRWEGIRDSRMTKAQSMLLKSFKTGHESKNLTTMFYTGSVAEF